MIQLRRDRLCCFVGLLLGLAWPMVGPLASATDLSRAAVAELAEAVDAALRPGMEAGATVAVRVLDADTGRVLLETPNAEQARIPASNMKLVTSATTLDLYGPEYRLPTGFGYRSGTVFVLAGGDPGFACPTLIDQGKHDYEAAMHGVAAFLAEAIERDQDHEPEEGLDLVVVDHVFDDQFVHPSWHPANLLHWYGAPVAGVNFNNNCVDVTFVPTDPGRPAELELVPPQGDFEIVGEAITLADAADHAPQLSKRANEPVFVVGGTVGRRGGPYSKPIDDPRRFFGEVMVDEFSRRGLRMSGRVEVTTQYPRQDVGPTGALLVTQPLQNVLGRVNTNSQNMMSEALAKLNGLAYDKAQGVEDPRGSWRSGHLAAADFLRRIEVDDTTLTAADGSGLSRDNRVSATLISDLLLHMLTEHEHGEHYVQSMAIAGVRGSVRNRMKPLEGRVFAKTGTIRGVSALSGYVFHDSGRTLVFSILHNDLPGSQGPYRRQQDAAVEAMWRWLDGLPELDEAIVAERSPQLLESLEAVSP